MPHFILTYTNTDKVVTHIETVVTEKQLAGPRFVYVHKGFIEYDGSDPHPQLGITLNQDDGTLVREWTIPIPLPHKRSRGTVILSTSGVHGEVRFPHNKGNPFVTGLRVDPSKISNNKRKRDDDDKICDRCEKKFKEMFEELVNKEVAKLEAKIKILEEQIAIQ